MSERLGVVGEGGERWGELERHGRRQKGQEEGRWGDVSCADGLREHRSKFHAVMSLQKQEM